MWKKVCRIGCTAALMAFCAIISVAAADYYSVGDTGDEILLIQKQLRKQGYDVKTDGVFSEDMAKAVSLFQKKQKIQVSGKVGGWTYYLLTGKRTMLPKDAQTPPTKSAAKEKKKKDVKTSKKKGKENSSKVKYTKLPDLRGSDRIGRELVHSAYKYIGTPYVFGGNTPAGFDCSGFTRYVFLHNGIKLPRMADEQYRMGYKVKRDELLPGDLVFFTTYAPGVSHTGIYVGDDNFISATTSGGIRVDSLKNGYWASRYVGAKRIR